MQKFKCAMLTLVSAFALSGAAHADDDYLSFNGGYYDVLRHKYPAAQFGVEYRFADVSYGIHPIVGGFITTDNEEYGYGGFNWAVAIIPHELYIVPNFAAGLNSEGNGRQLGGPIEFRSGLELDYQLPNTQQVGVAFNHISNADIYKHNPGEETLLLTYSIPIHTVVGLFNQ